MNISNWKIFNKTGSQLNWFSDSHINLTFVSDTGKDAAGYLVTDVSGNISDSVITNSGFLYTSDTSVLYNTIYDSSLIDITDKVDLNYVDVSIFNPEGQNVNGISGLSNIDIPTLHDYPSSIYGSGIFLEPTSVNIIESEHLFILDDLDGSLYRPFDSSISYLYVEMIGDDDEIKLFTIDEDENSVIWTDNLMFDISQKVENSPLSINIGFRAEEEGVFERTLRISAVVNNSYYTLSEISINSEAIGEDERHRTLLANFGLPDPKDFPKLFKEADINEDYLDFEIVNPKSKQMILDHNEIIPYIGTYKALINAIKWLGYDDIYVKEWFKNVKEDKKISLTIPYDAKDRANTILSFSPDERKVLKKLNQLSLNYCITTETGEIDEWGTPETKNCYEYNLNEVFVKLMSLKDWLEKNIIGVNARITDITGDGVYYDRYVNQIYSTDNVGYTYREHQSITPITYPVYSELTNGESSVNCTLVEFSKSTLGDLNVTFDDLTNYIWDPLTGNTLTPDDPSYLENPNNYLAVGPTFENPLIGVTDLQWKLSVEKTESGVVGEEYVTNPLWIVDNEIRYYDVLDSSSIFYDASTDLTIVLEQAYLRDPSIDIWEDSILYSIYPDIYLRYEQYTQQTITNTGTYSIIEGSGKIIYTNNVEESFDANELYPYNFDVSDDSVEIQTWTDVKIIAPYVDGYMLENVITGDLTKFDNYVYFFPGTNPLLSYAIDSNYNVPLLMMENFYANDENDEVFNLIQNKSYILDILDGKIAMDGNSSPSIISNINFNYDSSLYEQQISLNVEYLSPRVPIQIIDPSIYYWADPSGLSGGADPSSVVADNSIYAIMVNHIGDYTVEVFAYDGYNNMFASRAKTDHNVFIKHPTIYTLIDDQCNLSDVDCQTELLTVAEINQLVTDSSVPLYDKQVPMQGLEILLDEEDKPYLKIPSITYFQDVPQPGSINKFYNLTERVVSINGNDIVIDPDYQSFFKNDSVRIVYFNKNDYTVIDQHDASISAMLDNDITLSSIPSSYKVDKDTAVYLLNDTIRSTSNYTKLSEGFSLDIQYQGSSFRESQLVNIMINDICTGYVYGTSFKVQDEPINETHKFDYDLPGFVTQDPSRYEINAKYAFSTYTEFATETVSATEENNKFYIRLEDDYRQMYLDDTFVMINVLFDHEIVNDNWYTPPPDLVTDEFYYYKNPITIDPSTLVLLQSKYEDSNYLLDQKNVWTVSDNYTKDIIMKVYNDTVPYVFTTSGYYDVQVESYDKFGNLSTKIYEGLIQVR